MEQPCRREDLSYECRATLFDQEVSMAESIDFQFPMKKACSSAIDQFCKDIPHGHARTIRCLQDNLENAAMPDACRKEVQDHVASIAKDYRCAFELCWDQGIGYMESSGCHPAHLAKRASTAAVSTLP